MWKNIKNENNSLSCLTPKKWKLNEMAKEKLDHGWWKQNQIENCTKMSVLLMRSFFKKLFNNKTFFGVCGLELSEIGLLYFLKKLSIWLPCISYKRAFGQTVIESSSFHERIWAPTHCDPLNFATPPFNPIKTVGKFIQKTIKIYKINKHVWVIKYLGEYLGIGNSWRIYGSFRLLLVNKFQKSSNSLLKIFGSWFLWIEILIQSHKHHSLKIKVLINIWITNGILDFLPGINGNGFIIRRSSNSQHNINYCTCRITKT